MQLGSSWGRVQLQGTLSLAGPGASWGFWRAEHPSPSPPAALGIIRANPLNAEMLGLVVQPCLVLLP